LGQVVIIKELNYSVYSIFLFSLLIIIMVLISVTSVETDNGYQFANDFAESVIINPKSKVSLINFQFERKLDFVVLEGGNQFKVRVGDKLNSLDVVGIDAGTYTATSLAFAIQ
jgi:hypothetical protein